MLKPTIPLLIRFVFKVFAIYFDHFNCIATASNGCRRVEFAPEIDGRLLMNHTIKRTIVPSKDHCQINCYLESACVSYNYGPTENDALICELNDRTHLQVSRDDFVWKPGYTYRYTMV